MIVKRRGFDIDLSEEHKTQCPRCFSNGRDNSQDNLHVYGTDGDGKHLGAFCWACEYTILSEDKLAELEEDYEEEEEDIDTMGRAFDAKAKSIIKETTGLNPKNYRGISKETSELYKVRYQYSESDGSVTHTLYPATINYTPSGFKVRGHPKDFKSPGPIGETGKSCELFGQRLFKANTNFVVITGGEHDSLAAYQMLNNRKTKFEDIACVSPTIGESGAHRQVKRQYEWFNQFKKIFICMDNDTAGEEAAEKLAAVLPRGKVYILKMRHKDPNEYLLKGAEEDFRRDFWNADMYTPAGVHSSKALYDAVVNYSDIKQISLPDFLKVAQGMFDGGFVKGTVSTIFAKSSTGKSIVVDNSCVHWILNEPDETVGVLSLEASKEQWATNLFSHYLGKRLIKLKGQDRKDYLALPDVVEKLTLFNEREDGSPRYYVFDERGSEIEVIKEKILQMIIQLGVTIMVVDVYSDLLDGLDNSSQEEVSSWLKKLVKEYPHLTLILVAHTRKGKAGSNGPLTEDDVMGTSTIFKSSAQAIALERDKQAKNAFLRNCTFASVHKNRHFSETGPAGIIYFDPETGKLWDLDDYLEANPEMRRIAEEALSEDEWED